MKSNTNQTTLDELVVSVMDNQELSEHEKSLVLHNLAALKETRVNILITGATGSGKSSTINALFDAEKAVVGVGVDPETMNIARYDLNNIVIFDTPGLGDGKEKDLCHARLITEKLHERDQNGDMLIDLVLVILEGASRDMGTSYQLINEVIIPALGDEASKRLLVAINQADVAMKGRFWNYEKNMPEQELVCFLNEKVESVRRRVREATNIDIEPIYYAAGYKEKGKKQRPYNLSKLFAFILRHTRPEKRAVFIQDVNRNSEMWRDDDRLTDYRKEIRSSIWQSISDSASRGAEIGGQIGSYFGSIGKTAGTLIGGVIGGAIGAIGSFFRSFF